MDFKISGRRALVFGASKGLGRAIAKELIAEGVRVAIVSRDATRIGATAAELCAIGIAGDVSSPGNSTSLAKSSRRCQRFWHQIARYTSPARQSRWMAVT